MAADTPAKSIPDMQLFKDIFNTSPVGIAVETLDGQPLFVNPALCRFLGFTEEELQNKHCVDFSPKEDAEKDGALFQQLKAAQIDHYQLEKQYFRRDGSLVWGSLSISRIKSSSSSLVIAMVEDITAKKTAEDAMRESEERLRLAIQAGKMYAYEWDVTTNAVVRSGEVASVLGREVSILTRQEVLARVHPDDRALFAASVTERTPDNPDTQISYRVLDPGGSVKWLGKTAHAYFDGNGRMVRMIGMVADITERKSGEEKLREYERAVEGVEEFISVFDREYRCIMTNRAYLSRKRLAREQVVGHFARELVDEETYETVVRPRLDECFQGKMVRYELRYTYPEIGERDLLATYYPIEGWTGVDRVVCVLHDITDRKRAERALADMNRKLIEAQEQERARIARELHDDIGQRLALLAVELEQLRQNPFEAEERMQELREQTSEISKDVQALAHDLHPAQIEYLGALAGIKNWCRDFGERKGMQIDFRDDVGNALPREIGLCLFRVVQEALNNAARHSGVKRAEVQLAAGSGEIHLIVSDSGKGFDMAATQRLGLGLTSMRERVRLVNGTIMIESQPQGGTHIHVRVPFRSERVSQTGSGLAS